MRAGRLARLCVVPALAGIILVATAVPAWAHAILNSADPPKDGVAAQSPPKLSLTFNENVEVSFGAIRVYTCAGAAHHDRRPAPLRRQRPHGRDVDPEARSRRLPGRVAGASRPTRIRSTAPIRSASGPGAAPSVNGCATETTAKSSTTRGHHCSASPRAGVFAGLALLIGGVVFLVLIAGGTERGAVDPPRDLDRLDRPRALDRRAR